MCKVTAGTEVRTVGTTKWHLAFSVKVLVEDGVVPGWSWSWFRLLWLLVDAVHQDSRLSAGRRGAFPLAQLWV